jgi:hypothetical protein
MPSQRLKERLEALRGGESGQLESLFGEHVSRPPGRGYRRVFDRETTFWAFLGQVLGGGSCRDATRAVQASRQRRGQGGISSANAGFCQARARLPLEWLHEQGHEVARRLQASARWEWRGRRVLLTDATSCQLPDTAANQAAYPQPGSQRPGCGQPVMQLCGLFELGSGALLGWEHSPWDVHEASLFESAVAAHLREGDVLVADRAYDAYRCLALCQQRGADLLARLHSRRHCPLQAGQSEARATLTRPALSVRPEHCTKEEWLAMPEQMQVRFIRVRLSHPGFRSQEITLITTILDAPAEALAALYLRRWQIEVCFRDIKTTLGMELLRGKSPAICEREVAMHLLAYNLLRTLMLQAAQQENQSLPAMSFAGARDAARRFAPVIAHAPSKAKARAAKTQLLRCIGNDPIPIRPGRCEPRAVKRRPKAYQLLNRPRKHMQTAPSRRLK